MTDFPLKADVGVQDGATKTVRNACIALSSAPQQIDFSMDNKVIPAAVCGVRSGDVISTVDGISSKTDLTSINRLCVQSRQMGSAFQKDTDILFLNGSAHATILTNTDAKKRIFWVSFARVFQTATGDASIGVGDAAASVYLTLVANYPTNFVQSISFSEPIPVLAGQTIVVGGTDASTLRYAVYGWYE